MRQAGDGARFDGEPLDATRIEADGRQQLDRHATTERGVLGFVDFAHAAGAQEREKLVAAESTTNLNGHGLPNRAAAAPVRCVWAPRLRLETYYSFIAG